VAGKVWLFTLGPKGEPSLGGSIVAEIGPVPLITAPEYLLRINNTGGPPGGKTPVHTHPGSETFYVLTGQLSQKSPHSVSHVDAGHGLPGHGPDMPMEISSSGTRDLKCPSYVYCGRHQAILVTGHDALGACPQWSKQPSHCPPVADKRGPFGMSA
jgi:hypothetical protein